MNERLPRRGFLRVVAQGGALAGAGCLGVACGGATAEPTGTIEGGNISSSPIGSLRAVSGSPLAIGRDANGLYAMTLVCTHQQCDMATDGTVSANLVTCSCHGSEFDGNGAVLRGPAVTPLEHFAVTVSESGDITVNAGDVVDASVRTAVG